MGDDNLRNAIKSTRYKMRVYKMTGASLKTQEYARMASQLAELKARAKDLGVDLRAKRPKVSEVKQTSKQLRKVTKAFRA